jgi:putative ABC transport system ATP-binding protein
MSGLFGWLSGSSTQNGRYSGAASLSRKTTEESPALESHALIKSFGQGETQTIAVNDVSLKLRRHELALLMGPSGSGKSTLLAMISGLLRPDNGKVIALNEDMWRFSSLQMERFRLKHCSYIFQGCNLFPALSARQQLELVLRWGEGASPREARDRAQSMLTQLGLGKKGHLRPGALSGGEKQRVAIARALVKEPTYLFADEPTSALDWENGQQVIELLHKAAHTRGAMVLVVTHDSRLLPYADRVFHMEDGRLVSEELMKKAAPEPQKKSPEVVVVDTAPKHAAPTMIPLPKPTPVSAAQGPRVALGAYLQDVSMTF